MKNGNSGITESKDVKKLPIVKLLFKQIIVLNVCMYQMYALYELAPFP